jgi:hypothetical protein
VLPPARMAEALAVFGMAHQSSTPLDKRAQGVGGRPSSHFVITMRGSTV